MRGGCMGQLISYSIIGALIIWFVSAPESVAGLLNSIVGLVVSGGQALGRFVSAINLDVV